MPLTKPAPPTPAAGAFIGPPPKPILKPSPVPTPARQPSPMLPPQFDAGNESSSSTGSTSRKHAHFPPPGQEPTARYSGVDYDRTPIVVLPNACALPARGCPGKTYFQDDERSVTVSPTVASPPLSNHAHPAKLMKKHSHRPPAIVGNAPTFGHSHSDTTSSDDYYDYSSSDDNQDPTRPREYYQRVAVVFPPGSGSSSPTTMFSTERIERDRKVSDSSSRTVIATPTALTSPSPGTRRKGVPSATGAGFTPAVVSTGRRAWSSTSESSEEDCLGGF